MSIPVLLSLIAEPLTGLVDTAFVSRLGSIPLAALGVGAIALSGVFWIFNFLGIGTQTEIAQSLGRKDNKNLQETTGIALFLSCIFGGLLAICGFFFAPYISKLMGADAEVFHIATVYIQIRLLGAPAVLGTLSLFGVFRGLQDMRTPSVIAIGVNLLNILLDWPFIFGFGGIPGAGAPGAAAASVISQWAGVIIAFLVIYKRIGLSHSIVLKKTVRLLKTGSDLFIRTGLLTAFMLLTTRSATLLGPDAGAAHQAVRQVWLFAAFLLDAFAITGQSLIGFFIGSQHFAVAKRAAFVVFTWSFWVGIAISIVMWSGREFTIFLMVPQTAAVLFSPAWMIAALFQPINALAFAADGVLWGASDFRYLRNVMIITSGTGAIALYLMDKFQITGLNNIWIVIGVWIGIRAVFGVIRIWPGVGKGLFS